MHGVISVIYVAAKGAKNPTLKPKHVRSIINVTISIEKAYENIKITTKKAPYVVGIFRPYLSEKYPDIKDPINIKININDTLYFLIIIIIKNSLKL